MLFHDAVRPLLSISASSTTASRRWSATRRSTWRSPRRTRSSTVDDDAAVITSIPDRARLRRGQTPQAFRLSTIRRAYEAGRRTTRTSQRHRRLRGRAALPARTCRSTSCAGDEHNMKVTHPVDVFLADKLFQLASHQPRPARPTEEDYRERLAGKTLVVFGGSYGIGADIADAGRALGAKVFTLRPLHDRHARGEPRATSTTRWPRRTTRPAASTTSSTPPACCTSARSPRPTTTVIEESAAGQLPRPRSHRPGGAPATSPRPRASCCSTPPAPTPAGRAGYSLYSSTKAAMVNLTQALADEWAERRRPGQLHQPRAHRHPDAHQAPSGEEPAGTLLSSGRRPDLHRRAAVRPDRARHRRPPSRTRCGRPGPRPRRHRAALELARTMAARRARPPSVTGRTSNGRSAAESLPTRLPERRSAQVESHVGRVVTAAAGLAASAARLAPAHDGRAAARAPGSSPPPPRSRYVADRCPAHQRAATWSAGCGKVGAGVSLRFLIREWRCSCCWPDWTAGTAAVFGGLVAWLLGLHGLQAASRRPCSR